MEKIKEYLAREDVKKVFKIISYILNPIITVFCVLGILIMLIGNFAVIKGESDRRDKDILFYLNDGEYAQAYETYFLLRSIDTVSGEEFRKYEEYYNFYDNFVMSRIKSCAGKSDEAKECYDAMQGTLDESEFFEMKPIYEYLLSLEDDSWGENS